MVAENTAAAAVVVGVIGAVGRCDTAVGRDRLDNRKAMAGLLFHIVVVGYQGPDSLVGGIGLDHGLDTARRMDPHPGIVDHM